MDRYDRLGVLGHGAYGVALLVRERAGPNGLPPVPASPSALPSSQLQVVKEIDISSMPAGQHAEAMAEVSVLRSLAHPNIVGYVRAFMEKSRLYIVMEFADGGDFSKAVARCREEDRSFGENEVLSMFSQCCLALRHIHNMHILHRDLKCQNIFLTKTAVVKLGDFGISKVLEHTGGQARTQIGTPTYLSPEVCDNLPYGTKADMWSIGVVLHELMALERPFTGQNIAALFYKILTGQPNPLPQGYSADLRDIVAMLLRKCPEERPSADEVLALPLVREQVAVKAHGDASLRSPGSRESSLSRTPSAPSCPRKSGRLTTPRASSASVVTPASPDGRGYSRPPLVPRSSSNEERAPRSWSHEETAPQCDLDKEEDGCASGCADDNPIADNAARSRPPLAPSASNALPSSLQRQHSPKRYDYLEQHACKSHLDANNPSPSELLDKTDSCDITDDSWLVDSSQLKGDDDERTLLPTGKLTNEEHDKNINICTVEPQGEVHHANASVQPQCEAHSHDEPEDDQNLFWDTIKDAKHLSSQLSTVLQEHAEVPQSEEKPNNRRAQWEESPPLFELPTMQETIAYDASGVSSRTPPMQESTDHDPVVHGSDEGTIVGCDSMDAANCTQLLYRQHLQSPSDMRALLATPAKTCRADDRQHQTGETPAHGVPPVGFNLNSILQDVEAPNEQRLREREAALQEARTAARGCVNDRMHAREARASQQEFRTRQQCANECARELPDGDALPMLPSRVRSRDAPTDRDWQPSSARGAKAPDNGSFRSPSPRAGGRSAAPSARKPELSQGFAMIYPPLDCLRGGALEGGVHDLARTRRTTPSVELDPVHVRPRTGPALSSGAPPLKSRALGRTSNCTARAAAASCQIAPQQLPVARSSSYRERKEAAEAEHRRALAEAAAQSRSDRKHVVAKMRQLERSNAVINTEVEPRIANQAGDEYKFLALRIGLDASNEERNESFDGHGGKDNFQHRNRPSSASRRPWTTSAACRAEARCPVVPAAVVDDRRSSHSAAHRLPRTGLLGRGM